MPANVGEMFYYGEVPWHGQGNKVECPLTVEEAIQAGGLDWEVGTVDLQTAEEPASPVSNRMAIVRLDRKPGNSGRTLGVTHRGFKPLQNREGALIFDAIFGRQKDVYHTGGYLKNGEVVWLLAKLPKEMEILAGDKVNPYALFTNSHDGTIAIDFRITTALAKAVVSCDNPISVNWAILDFASGICRIRPRYDSCPLALGCRFVRVSYGQMLSIDDNRRVAEAKRSYRVKTKKPTD
ncbi:MAG TPA: DUF932 domain-containing protein [Syntrophorhabdales bacterium]|nr:DUF932 domain-containing protein [Syntrophorhabdales bacterium]